MSGTSTAQARALRARRARLAGRPARLLIALACAAPACRERVAAPTLSTSSASAGQAGTAAPPAGLDERPQAEGGAGGQTASGAGAGTEPARETEPSVVVCGERESPPRCSAAGDSRQGVRVVGTLLAPHVTLKRAVLDLDASGHIRCAACDCGDAGQSLVIDCPDLVIAPGLINLHDHLSYSGTPPLAHPGRLYEHRNDWRLGRDGHDALPFSGNASTAQVLAQELRMVMGGATSIVGAGGRRGLLRNLDVPGLTEGLLPGVIRAETFPLDDADGAGDPARCEFGEYADTTAVSETAQAYVAHLGEGTNQRAADELRCALGELDLLRENGAIVHAMALGRSEAERLARLGASVVWSPRSNIDLYGSTAPVGLLSSLGVRIALGTDWLASGSMNLLRELWCARTYDEAVLGGHFDAAARLRMVTEHAAWAIGLEQRLGELRPGLVGDVALFTERDEPRASVVEAQAADVRLVLRQGRPLYGDAGLVSRFHGAESCEALLVCDARKLVCTTETGLNLVQIAASADAVYPLFSCDAPAHEPSCEPVVSRECPAGEADCSAPAAAVREAARDSDSDGIRDFEDLCPRQPDREQADEDGDGRGDVCDPCPVTNPGLSPCPLSIAALRAPGSRLPLGSAVLLREVRVTALRTQGAKGYYVEDGDHAPFSGLFVYTDDSTPSVVAGELVTLQGYFAQYRGTDQLLEAELLERNASPEQYLPLAVALADVSDGSALAPSLASLFVRIDGLTVDATNPDAPDDYDETGVAGGLRLDDLLFAELDNLFAVGTHFKFVQGISGASFSHQKLWPRASTDLVLR